MASEETGRGLGGFLSRLGGRKTPESEPGTVRVDEPLTAAAPAYPTKALRKFLSTLSSREAPVLLDLGPVIGSNLNFFGESLGCKVFIEDMYADVERHLKAGTTSDLPDFIRKRLRHAESSIDGVLAWDLLDFLDGQAAQVLAAELVRVMKPEAALLAFFATAAPRGQLTPTQYTKYIVIDEQTLRHRPYPAFRGRQRVLQNRDIIRMFEGLRVSDSFLLQTNLREILFRKPAYLAAVQSTA